ncbi:MAG TPA: hypothetical protein VF278_12365 [Pirellulales bacterium]
MLLFTAGIAFFLKLGSQLAWQAFIFDLAPRPSLRQVMVSWPFDSS